MTIQTHKWWTLERDGETVHLRQYTTRTRLRGDEASHIDCHRTQHVAIPLDGLAAAMREHNINEFTAEEDARWELEAPGCE